ncbi:MAG: hypothetical protein ABIK31_00400 [candidate division WOR-3 bacterium]
MKKVFYRFRNTNDTSSIGGDEPIDGSLIEYKVYYGNISNEFIERKISLGFSVLDDIEITENTVLFPNGGYTETIQIVDNKLIINRVYTSFSIDEVKNQLQKQLFNFVDVELNKIISLYPSTEPLTWAVKRDEAERWVGLTDSEKDSLISVFQTTSEAPESYAGIFYEACPEDPSTYSNIKSLIDSLAGRILTNSFNFKRHSHRVLGLKTKYNRLISEASSLAELQSVFEQIQGEFSNSTTNDSES